MKLATLEFLRYNQFCKNFLKHTYRWEIFYDQFSKKITKNLSPSRFFKLETSPFFKIEKLLHRIDLNL